MQPTLFDPPRPVTPFVIDPPAQQHSATSVAAADGIRVSAHTLRAKVFEFIQSAGFMGATDEEVQTGLNMGASTQRPRRVELVRGGMVFDSGRQRKTASGRNRVRVGIEAPADFKIYRNELLTRLNLEDNSDSAPVG